MRRLLPFPFLVAVVLGSCARSQPPAQHLQAVGTRPVSRDPVPLLGTVIDENTGRPLPFVRLRLDRAGFGSEAMSDSQGHFRLMIAEPGRWIIEAQRDGYILEQKRLAIDCGTGIWNVEGWSPDACPVPPDSILVRMRSLSALRSDSTVHGRVLEERTGKPLRAIVRFDDRTGTLSSEQTGDYSLPGRAPGVYSLEVTVLGYEPERRLVVIACPPDARDCTKAGTVLNAWMRPSRISF
jgi:hypothetical protein